MNNPLPSAEYTAVVTQQYNFNSVITHTLISHTLFNVMLKINQKQD